MDMRTFLALVLISSISFSASQQSELPSSILQFRHLIMMALVLTYVFASGRIADFLLGSGQWISKKEVLLAPFAYMFFASIGVIMYFFSSYWIPPQDTIVAKSIYLLFIPLAIATGIGAFILFAFFHSRINVLQSFDLSARIVFAPIFDGLKGYWTMINTVFILGAIATLSFYSSGSNFSLVAMDFLLLSAVVSLYFVFKALTEKGSESRAADFVTAITLIAPGIMKFYFKDLVCAGLALIPFSIFAVCPLNMIGNEVTVVISVISTLLLLVPIIPVAYAAMVNVLRFMSVLDVLIHKEKKATR